MIVLPQGLARAFRAVARKCSMGRPKGPAPPVVIRVDRGRLTLTSTFPEAVLVCEVPVPDAATGTLIVPAAVLDAIDTAGPLELAANGLTGLARWSDRAGPREMAFDALLPGRQHEPVERPGRMSRVPMEFLAALHECGRVASKDPGRFAIHRVQVRGKAGGVVGTDGKQALVWCGFRFPFADDLLVPALPVFGTKVVSAEAEARLGRTERHLVVTAGPWSVFLSLETKARFPDVHSVIPRFARPTTVELVESDAVQLLDRLARQPQPADEEPAVTLAVDGSVDFRLITDAGLEVVPAVASTTTGPTVTTVLHSGHLARAITLGLRTLRVQAADKPIVFGDRNRTYLTMPLAANRIVPRSQEEPEPMAGDATPDTDSLPQPKETSMNPGEMNGRHDPPPGEAEPLDPLAEAEALKAALVDATHQAGRLVQSLKHGRRQKRQLESAWTALRALNLDPGGRP